MLKGLDRWLLPWIFRQRSRAPSQRHVILAVCDHFEPFHGAKKPQALSRVATWHSEYSRITTEFRDSGGTPPRHTFFYPIEQWDEDVCGALAVMCHNTGGEAEIHLHHKNDTAEKLAHALVDGKTRMARLGLLSKDETGVVRYGFIHGNWALDHSHPEGKACGVTDELRVLRQTGCYADFTLPSAPSPCQVKTINSIYYAREDGKARSHERGEPARAGQPRPESYDELLLVQGPLGLNWKWRKLGVFPRIENADITGANPPTAVRLALWEQCHIHVQGKPEWLFIKLHTHGAVERNSEMLLGAPMRDFHRHLAQAAREDKGFHYHYVSAREMVNILHAAEAGHSGNPHEYRDFRYRKS